MNPRGWSQRSILLVALILRLLPIAATRADEAAARFALSDVWDEADYASYAEHLWRGEGYVDAKGERSFRPPGYPALIAATFAIGGRQFLVLRIVQAVIGVGSCWLVGMLAGRIWGPAARPIATWIAAIYPPFLYYSPQVLNSTLYMALVTATIASLVWASEGRPWRALLPGMALGAGSLTAGTILGAAPVLAAWLGWRRRSSGAVPAAAAALLMLLGAAAVIAPWTWRNYRVHGGLVPLATNSGSVLYLGNANYERWVDPAAPDRQDLYAAERDAAALTELERYRLFREGAIEWIRENPGKFVLQWCVKFSRMWNPIPRGKGVLLALASVLTHGIVLALALVGAWQGLRRRSPEVGLLAVYLFTISAVHAVFILTQRHRVPLADGFLIVLASGTVTRLIGGYGQGGRPACYSAAAHPGGAG